MEGISILYNEALGLSGLYSISVKELSGQINRKINMQFCRSLDIIEKVSANPNYNFIVMHLGELGESRNSYRTAMSCRRYSNAVLVAESGIYPFGKEEILQYFDEYMEHLMFEGNLENLFKKYGFISGKVLEAEEKARDI